jgi:hypothetical protein
MHSSHATQLTMVHLNYLTDHHDALLWLLTPGCVLPLLLLLLAQQRLSLPPAIAVGEVEQVSQPAAAAAGQC